MDYVLCGPRAQVCVCVGFLSDEQVHSVEEEIHYLSIRRLLMQTLMGLVHVPGDSQDPGSGSRTGSGSRFWSRVWSQSNGRPPSQRVIVHSLLCVNV